MTEAVIVTGSSAGIDTGPCVSWPAIITCDLAAFSPSTTGVALTAAIEVLYALTGRQFGTCQLTVRPCRRSCMDDVWPWPGSWWTWGEWPRPLFYQGAWYNITCGGCPDGTCSCTEISECRLPVPIASVDQVKVDGVVLAPTAYQVRDFRYLQRIDGGTWPICNDLMKADTETGTWSVQVTFGAAVPELGQLALGELFCQFAKLLNHDTSCALPKPVQQLVRQGVTMNFLDPNELFTSGRLGLYVCDLFISTTNPQGLASRSRVYDIDGDGFTILGL